MSRLTVTEQGSSTGSSWATGQPLWEEEAVDQQLAQLSKWKALHPQPWGSDPQWLSSSGHNSVTGQAILTAIAVVDPWLYNPILFPVPTLMLAWPSMAQSKAINQQKAFTFFPLFPLWCPEPVYQGTGQVLVSVQWRTLKSVFIVLVSAPTAYHHESWPWVSLIS